MRTLRTALSSGKLSHAYLFSGPRGSGKTSAAKILARCIDCVRGPTPDPDNTCENCLAMLAGNALDVIEVDAASNRGIEEIRALRESVKFAPASMRAKVFIIDEAHMLTREGANAFLKTLEEPPAHAVFILATTAPEALPATILSRCQRYAFRRIPVDVTIERLREISAAEGIVIDDGALGAIAYRSDGGLRDALTMLEQVAAYANGSVDTATVDAAFGTTGRQYAAAVVGAILASDAGAALRVVDEASDAGADMLGLVRGAISEYRNLLVARIDPALLARDLSQSDAGAVVELARATQQHKVVRGLRLLADALAAARTSGNPRLELETAVLRLIVQTEDPSLEALAARVAALEGASQQAPPEPVRSQSVASKPAASKPAAMQPAAMQPATLQPAASQTERPLPLAGETPSPPVSTTVRFAAQSQAAAPAVAAPPIAASVEPPLTRAAAVPPAEGRPIPTLQQVRSLWDQIRLRAEEKSKPLRSLLSRTTVDALEDGALFVGIGDPIQEGILRERAATLEEAIAEVLRVPLRVVVKSRASASGRTPGPARASAPSHAAPEASANGGEGEIDLLAYAREKLG